jgi:hypothetical protein
MVQRKKQRHVQKATLLAVGEGPADKAFLNHLKELYSHNTGQKVTVEAEDGGSPDVMVYNVIKKHQHQAFDRKILLLDEDVPVSDSAISRAQKGKLELIFSTPVCLEGMLLDVLGQPVPKGFSARECKASLHPQLSGPITRRESYRALFPQPVIDKSRKLQIVRLRALLRNETMSC